MDNINLPSEEGIIERIGKEELDVLLAKAIALEKTRRANSYKEGWLWYKLKDHMGLRKWNDEEAITYARDYARISVKNE